MRATGTLQNLAGLNPGDHVAWVVASDVAFEDLTAASFAQGAADGDKNLFFGPGATLKSAASLGAAEACDPHEAFLGGGRLDPAAMLEAFRVETRNARAAGYRGLRVVADMDWLLPASASASEVAGFEQQLDQVVTELGAIVVCAYRPKNMSPTTVGGVVSVHPLSLGETPADLGFRIWSLGKDLWEMSGEFDAANDQQLSNVLKVAAADAGSSLTMSWKGVEFIDVAGFRAVADIALARPELAIAITDAAPGIKRCWELLGLSSSLSTVNLS